ncbi:DnaA regulatory inactivator Hda [Gammaproteobacteria bacterium 45_16_T64]|nr:DnaA regulatory inactivator Hda [Gammaproteobacteria bacterium 45_16_T64]
MAKKHLTPKGQQLTLSLGRKPRRDFDGFVVGGNAQLVAGLKALPGTNDRGFYFVWGEQGCGKSHLLQAQCQLTTLYKKRCIYLEAEQLMEFGPEVLDGMEHFDLVCVDDMDELIKQPGWEVGMFHFYNKLFDTNSSLLVSAKVAPRMLDITLADLKSRLCSGETYQITRLTDEAKVELMVSSAYKRGFQLTPDVAEYIIQRSTRDVSSLEAILDQLDALSLSEQRLITVPFVKKALGW